jgi:hypothetical protein
MEAAPLDRALFSDLEALAGDGSLLNAQRRGILRQLGAMSDRLLCVVLHLPGDVQRAAKDGGDYFQSEALLALCRLRSS